MGSSSSNAREAAAAAPPPPPPAPPGPLHAMDADEDDESVKQLNECAALYLSLQDCLAESDRNWKACQARKHRRRFSPRFFFLVDAN
uniref:CHCH domain-containing protein n=1 Tax=Aegilops tauschii subsp. strangulata TaxID=200361 RepID=A0A452Z2R9_AEGTS